VSEAATRCEECEDPHGVDEDGLILAHETPFGETAKPHPLCEGAGRPPLNYRPFLVRGNMPIVVKIAKAKSADDAANQVNYAEGPLNIEYDGIVIEAVVSADKVDDFDAPDERRMCQRDGCGHLVEDHFGDYTDRGEDGKPKSRDACSRWRCGCPRPYTSILKEYSK
jgi:hypothetical protein